MNKKTLQKLYCYVDEAGQDSSSSSFVVVAVVSDKKQELLRRELLEVEKISGTGSRKWHKSRKDRRMKYLTLVMDRKIGHEEVFFGSYPKPIPYFFPLLDVLERAINVKASAPYAARIFIDGIDRRKADELTNALRSRGVSLGMVRSRRDESEPLIRLADMWAGCIRAALGGSQSESSLLKRAEQHGYITRIKENTP